MWRRRRRKFTIFWPKNDIEEEEEKMNWLKNDGQTNRQPRTAKNRQEQMWCGQDFNRFSGETEVDDTPKANRVVCIKCWVVLIPNWMEMNWPQVNKINHLRQRTNRLMKSMLRTFDKKHIRHFNLIEKVSGGAGGFVSVVSAVGDGGNRG